MENDKYTGGDATIFDVAREAGVSYSTVSRVINEKEYVSAEKRQRVQQAMARLGYVANTQARSLAGGRTNIIGLLVHGLNTSYISEIMKGIDNELGEARYDLMLFTTHRYKAREAAYVAKLTRNAVDGLLLVLPRNAEAYLETLRARHFPYVLVDHQGSCQHMEVPSIGTENWKGAYEATRYLLALGHRRIGFITGTMDMACASDRLAGYQAALQDVGISPLPELIREGDFMQPGGYRCAEELLRLAEPPTAIFASNDISAFGVMEAVRVHGLQIPRDISIVGFDDLPQAASTYPPLTTVRQPLEEVGASAARLLLRYIEDTGYPVTRINLPLKLIVRESCAKL